MGYKTKTTLGKIGMETIDLLIVTVLIVAAMVLSRNLSTILPLKLFYIISEIILFTVVTLYLFLTRENFIKSFRWNRIPSDQLVTLFFVTMFFIPLIFEINIVFSGLFPVSDDQKLKLFLDFKISSIADLILLIAGPVLCASIVEESIFRGYLQKKLENLIPAFPAILLASVLFALMHSTYQWIPQLLILALFMGFLTWKFNSIIPALGIHALNNLLQILNINFGLEVTESFLIWNNHVNPLITIISCIGFFHYFRKILNFQREK